MYEVLTLGCYPYRRIREDDEVVKHVRTKQRFGSILKLKVDIQFSVFGGADSVQYPYFRVYRGKLSVGGINRKLTF